MANDLKWYQNHVLWRRLHDRRKNDVSFIVADQINLYEQQSTYSSNMPLRGLFYFSQQYEGFIVRQKHNLYGSKLVKLPTPQYIVFYNGKKNQPDQEELLLSDAYEAGRGSGCLECRAQLLNINRGHNKALMEKCRRLWEYSEFVSEVEEQLKAGLSRDEAIQSAIDHCIEQGILTDILKSEKSEVLHMIFLTEYDEKKHLRHTFEEGKEEGRIEGREDKLLELIQKKRAKGRSVETIAEELEEDVETIRCLLERYQDR